MGKNSLLGCKTDYDLMFGPYFVPRLHPPTLVERICLVWNSWQSLLMLKRGFRLILHNVFGWKPNFYKQLLATRCARVGHNLSFCLTLRWNLICVLCSVIISVERLLNQGIYLKIQPHQDRDECQGGDCEIPSAKSRCMIPWAGRFWSRCSRVKTYSRVHNWKRLGQDTLWLVVWDICAM